MIPRKYYEVTDGDDHVGYVSEEYTMKKFDEKFLTGKAECNFLIGKYEAIDVEPVVRCKDCKFYKTSYTWNGKECKVCGIEPYAPVRKLNDFCSRGERKEDETT